jgi:hypothetical protein
LAVHHHFARGTQSAAREFQRQHPGARRPGEVRLEGRWPQVLTLRDRIEIVQQREDFLGLMPRIASDGHGSQQCIRRHIAIGIRCRREETAAGIGRHLGNAAGQQIGQRGNPMASLGPLFVAAFGVPPLATT